ncbi:hypothetical protein GCM10023319_13630 [Nocardia iowensis]
MKNTRSTIIFGCGIALGLCLITAGCQNSEQRTPPTTVAPTTIETTRGAPTGTRILPPTATPVTRAPTKNPVTGPPVWSTPPTTTTTTTTKPPTTTP